MVVYSLLLFKDKRISKLKIYYFDLVKKISLKTKNIGIPMIYNKEIKNDKFEKWSFLKDKDLVVFNHSRQLWKKNIIEAFSKIVNEYGEDSKLLIRKFGIEHFVHWMPRKEMLILLQILLIQKK